MEWRCPDDPLHWLALGGVDPACPGSRGGCDSWPPLAGGEPFAGGQQPPPAGGQQMASPLSSPPLTISLINMFDEDHLSDDALLHVAFFLPAAEDLLRFALACRRFGAARTTATTTLSMAEESARRWLAGRSEQERGWAPQRGSESWLGLMREVELLLLPLAFSHSNPGVVLSDNLTVASVDPSDSNALPQDLRVVTAASRVVMRSGRHFVQFTAVSGETAMFGAIRPGLDLGNLPFAGTKQEQELQLRQVRLSCFFEEREKTRCDACNQRLRAPVRCNLLQCWGCKADVWAATKNPPDAEAAAAAIRPAARDPHAQDGHCMYISLTGKHQDHGSTWRAWDGMQGATDGDRIGMLLDLDQGSMTLYKNGDLLGRMVAGGLSGEYCWAATMLFGWDTMRIGNFL